MPDSVTTIGIYEFDVEKIRVSGVAKSRSLNRVPASAGVRTGMSHLSGGR